MIAGTVSTVSLLLADACAVKAVQTMRLMVDRKDIDTTAGMRNASSPVCARHPS